MKKLISIILTISIILSFSNFAFASDFIQSRTIEINLPLSKDAESVKIMNESLSNNSACHLKLDNTADDISRSSSSLSLRFKQELSNESETAVSGDGVITLDSNSYSFNFNEQILSLTKLNNESSIYTGIIKSTLTINKTEVPITIDFATTYNYKESLASISIGLLEDAGQTLFFGDIFDIYDEYYKSTFEKVDDIDAPSSSVNSGATRTTNQFAHVGIARNSTLGGVSGGETVVMTVQKRDFRDRDSKDFGFEQIRVFSRASNALNYVSSATSAYPVNVNANFSCITPDFLDVDDVTPKNSSSSMPGVFNIFAQLHPSIGALIAGIDLGFTSVAAGTAHNIYSESGHFEENAASGTITISGLNNMNNLNLPSSISWSNANSDTTHGAVWRVKYTTPGNDQSGSASVVVSANIDYRFYYSNNRTTVKTTGNASLGHYIFK